MTNFRCVFIYLFVFTWLLLVQSTAASLTVSSCRASASNWWFHLTSWWAEWLLRLPTSSVSPPRRKTCFTFTASLHSGLVAQLAFMTRPRKWSRVTVMNVIAFDEKEMTLRFPFFEAENISTAESVGSRREYWTQVSPFKSLTATLGSFKCKFMSKLMRFYCGEKVQVIFLK